MTTGGESACYATAVRKASRRVSQLYDDALAPSGLKSTQLAILSRLASRAKSPPTMGELADALVMDRSALGHNLRPLERDGFVVLAAGGTDRRSRHVMLTAQGSAKYREGHRLWLKGQDRFAKVVGKKQAAAIRSALLLIAHDDRLGRLIDPAR